MATETEPITLRVSEALTRDVGRGLVRLDPQDMSALGVQTGETVRVIGKRGTVAKALPPVEMDFSGMPKGALHVMDARAKFEVGSAEYKGTRAKIADVPIPVEGIAEA